MALPTSAISVGLTAILFCYSTDSPPPDSFGEEAERVLLLKTAQAYQQALDYELVVDTTCALTNVQIGCFSVVRKHERRGTKTIFAKVVLY